MALTDVQWAALGPLRAALYCRVSTADQSCARQERDLVNGPSLPAGDGTSARSCTGAAQKSASPQRDAAPSVVWRRPTPASPTA